MYTNLVYIENTANMRPSNMVEEDHKHAKNKGEDLQRIYCLILAISVVYPCGYEIT